MNNSGASSSNALHHHISSDFIPCSDPNTSSGSFGHQNRQSDHHQQNSRSAIIGPALPPDLNPIPSCSGNTNDPNSQPGTSFPNIDGLDDIGGPSSMMMMMPPDEPQCSSSSALMDDHHSNRENHHNLQNHHLPQQHPGQRKQGGGGGRSLERQIGPTLPSSSEDEEEEEDVEDEEEEVEEVLNGQDEEPIREAEVELNGIDAELNYAEEQQQDEEEVEEMLIGPMPPAPGRSEDVEQVEYLARLAQFEANKAKASNGVKREEWMTELPQKMLKTGAFGLTATNKTSFSRSGASGEGASTSAAAIAAWTSVPNANGGQKNGNGPSTSSSHSASTSSAASKPPKRGEQDEWEEQRANQLNADRNVSLMDMHQKKRKIMDPANASDNLLRTSSGERRPFNRDTDMEVRGLGGSDPAALKERMGELSSRFGHSSEKKYL